MDYSLSADDFRRARATLDGLVHRTPLVSSRSLGARIGATAWLKAENLQKTGSFKPRGAFNRVRTLSAEERSRGIVTASAGNHGQAVALVARSESIPGVVVMPAGANPSKVAAVREYGAEAVLYGTLWDDAYARALEIAAERGLTFVHPFKDREIMSGQGTVACEILDDLPEVEVVVIPIGGGGLLAGMAMALRQLKPDVRIVGVEPDGSANMFRSRAAGRPVDLESVVTVADGLATRRTDPDVFAIIDAQVDDLVTVSDADLVQAMRFLLERTKLVTEPSGAAAVAALLSGKVAIPAGARTVAVLSGGNLDVERRLQLAF
jgi:threonine dehydratase